MVGDILQPTHLIFILVVALLVLGPKRLPEVARQLGKGLRDFRSAISGEDHHDDESPHHALHEPDEPSFETPPPTPDEHQPIGAPSPEPEPTVARRPTFKPSPEARPAPAPAPEPEASATAPVAPSDTSA